MLRRFSVGLLIALIAVPAFPCSTFLLVRNGVVIFGRNYDFEFGDGIVLINRRGLVKRSYSGTASWISRYGSVTFNQFGREFPMHSGSALPTANRTNNTYESSLAYLRSQRSMPGGSGSLERFARTAMLMQRTNMVKPQRDQAMSVLDNVAQPDWTRWSITYDVTHREVVWKTLTSTSEKTLRMSDLTFACSSPTMMIDVNVDAAGDVAPRLERYSSEANLQLLIHSYGATSFLRGTPIVDIEADAAHAESSRCANAQRRRAIR